MIVGLITPNESKIYLDDVEITKEPVYKRAQKGIGYLAQEASVFRKLTVEENILAVLEMTNLSKAAQREKTESLLEEFSLTHVRKNMGGVLSGGERRRTEIARALAVDPDLLILDEATSSVDPETEATIQESLKKLMEGRTSLIIAHRLSNILDVDEIVVMKQGAIIERGSNL